MPETTTKIDNPNIEKILLEWSSPARPYKERTREFYTTVASIAFLLGIILLLLKEFLLIGVIIAFTFLSYVLSSVKPENVVHQITTKGIRTDNKLFPWDEFTYFWLKKEFNQEMVIVKLAQGVPGAILMVINPSQKEQIINLISDKIPLETPSDSFVDRASRWLGDKIPLENS